MSHPHDSSAHPRSEDDRVDSRAVVLVGVAALATFAVAALAAMAYLRHETLLRPAPPLPPELGRTKIALVEQSLFFDGNVLRADKDRAARLARLNGWGWVDRDRGVGHVPIEVAMALVTQGARALPGTPPVAPPLGAARGGTDAPSVPVAPPPEAAPARGAPGAPAAAPKAPAGRGGAR
jgi:hypothetical protein